MTTLLSPGVDVSVTVGGVSAQPTPTTIPLVVFASRANKLTPDGTATAPGTTEVTKLRSLTSQRDLKQNYGNPVFVTADGVPVHGDETNEYGLFALYSFLGISNQAYVLRADIDLGQLVPTQVEPTLPAPDGTFWINSASLVGGVFMWNGTTWAAQTFHVFYATPAGGADGDWGFNYSTLDGTLVFRASGTWYAATTANLAAHTSSLVPLNVTPNAPTSPAVGDFWFKTSILSGGENLYLSKFRASDGTWVAQTVVNASSSPTPTQGVIWEDDSQIATTGNRPLYIGTGSAFIPLQVYVQPVQPVADPAVGTLWYDDTIDDFAMYYNPSDLWVPILTTTNSNPSATQKVISASAPLFPSTGAIWIDLSTQYNIDNYPVVKRYSGSAWTDITSQVVINDSALSPSISAANTYWINTGDPSTRNIVKRFDTTYTPNVVNSFGLVVPLSNSGGQDFFWRPDTGSVFGRKSQRAEVVKALGAAIVANDSIRSESVYFQLIVVPGYPELYDDMIELNVDNKEVAFIIADTPKNMIPSGVSTGKEITAADWATNVNDVALTGEQGFAGAGYSYAAFYYPWALATNVDGNNVVVPPSHVALRTYAYSDSVSAPWFPPAGYSRGTVTNANSVGYIDDNNIYQPLVLNQGQRDILYTNKINPIANIPTKGLTVFGQKTMDANSDALNRVNVARLIAKMKYDLNQLLQPFLFEINDSLTQSSAQIITTRYLAGLKTLRALYDFAAVCDSSNNTPATIDANQLWVSVAIKPSRAVEYIFIPITIVGTGDSLTNS